MENKKKQHRQDLQALNRAKDDFIAISSHQLRTPATCVKQYLAMILEGYAGDVPEDLRAYIQKAYDNNEKQLHILNDLLMVAELDSGHRKLMQKKEDICLLITEVIATLADTINSRRQHVTLLLPASCEVTVDAPQITVALRNLIENASRYSPEESEIVLKLEKYSSHIRISIIDHGIGIPKNTGRLFKKFARIDSPVSDTVSGNGLGLYLVRKIVKNHRGRIQVRSRPLKGSTFILELPLGEETCDQESCTET